MSQNFLCRGTLLKRPSETSADFNLVLCDNFLKLFNKRFFVTFKRMVAFERYPSICMNLNMSPMSYACTHGVAAWCTWCSCINKNNNLRDGQLYALIETCSELRANSHPSVSFSSFLCHISQFNSWQTSVTSGSNGRGCSVGGEERGRVEGPKRHLKAQTGLQACFKSRYSSFTTSHPEITI